MTSIDIHKIDSVTFEVSVQSGSPTTHIVTVAPAYADKLTDGKTDTETLVRRSFEFLLQREPNTSILRQFELPVIGRYFPEYERVIRGMLG